MFDEKFAFKISIYCLCVCGGVRELRLPMVYWMLIFHISDVTPSAVHVGNIVQGARLAWAQGRDIGSVDDETDNTRKVMTDRKKLAAILQIVYSFVF